MEKEKQEKEARAKKSTKAKLPEDNLIKNNDSESQEKEFLKPNPDEKLANRNEPSPLKTIN